MQANAIAAANLRRQAAADRQANRIAVRTAAAQRKQDAAQNAAILNVQQTNAALLAQTQDAPGQTELIDERETRRRAMAMGGFSPYGFRRGGPGKGGLGGGSPMLG
jgi:hypothetical protein